MPKHTVRYRNIKTGEVAEHEFYTSTNHEKLGSKLLKQICSYEKVKQQDIQVLAFNTKFIMKGSNLK